jgi:hypothetical protein
MGKFQGSAGPTAQLPMGRLRCKSQRQSRLGKEQIGGGGRRVKRRDECVVEWSAGFFKKARVSDGYVGEVQL